MQPWKGGPSSRNEVPTASRTKHLQKEAQDMELKLLELKRNMEKQRAAREGLLATAAAGSMWQNGATGLLRGNFRSKQQGGGAAPRDSQPSSSGRGSSTSQPSSRGSSAHAAGSRAGASGLSPSIPQQPSMQLEEAVVSGSRVSAAPAARPAAHAPNHRFGSARPADVLTVRHDDDQGDTGIGCGSDQPGSLLDGEFDEAENRRAFLDALNEWRKGNRPPSASSQDMGHGTSSCMGAAASSSHAPGATMEVQTEAATPRVSRPVSATKKSYFDKFLLNTASRQAGQSATGGVGGSSQQRPSTANSLGADRSGLMSGGGASSSGSAGWQQRPHSALAQRPGSAAPALTGKLDILERLERLELQQRQDEEDDDDDDDGDAGGVVVTTASGMLGLTKGVRLPDAILVPQDREMSDNSDA
mmetsp:Transcript_16084/g.34790  ORF Transcript_16084/g.34790 Transcript_16084/m.34790 type:complete len:416 (+) Transcript_16084:136-1383(+)|eukprot:CAMPEP_0202896342 /NCGR_PEP_ID=MMETSP1392-20130828/5367_1 /ASSEMBLY_ACC=CAM_ASM_000868 /TAXON_ID=225041 /ORGANISM="Chlamydomonas chlamydogama, Strain SAG 11-48b" /LENGTH=415 /DNA_ID=CAMNT_0049581669 /DNA_START=136 /DNA_END=1383 /DNA_ORIENTATION=-